MINHLEFNFGASNITTGHLAFQPGPMTVFVGPNNSGKSLVLREIEQWLYNPGSHFPPKIIKEIGLSRLSKKEVLDHAFGPSKILHPAAVPANYGIDVRIGNSLSKTSSKTHISVRTLYEGFAGNAYVGDYKKVFAFSYTIRLDGQTRLSLTREQKAGDLLERPINHLAALFVNPDALKRLRELSEDAFGLYFVIDPTSVGTLRVKMSSRPPIDLNEEQGLGPKSRDFHRQAISIEDLSDGVKAFTGLTAAMLSGNYRLILVDEPEAFLHPPLARKLGKVLTQTAYSRGASVFASTHSPEFLMGCIQAGNPVNVVRLTYQAERATARFLSSAELEHLMRDPLLRSTGILNALFHTGAVVCEGDIDRALYEEVNARLAQTGEGLADILFLNAIGKQTLHRIVAPLRKMGIPTAAVVDLDILKEGDLAALLRAAYVPDQLIDSWSNLKRRIYEKFKELDVDPKKSGIGILDGESQEIALNLIDNAAAYGIFIVPVGEVESWLSDLGATGTKTKWIESLFDLMGSDPSSPQYLRPSAGDVWDFMRRVARWIGDPQRKGIPG